MCDPISLIGLGLTAGGTAMQASANNAAASARSAALNAERTRQRGLEQRQSGLVDQGVADMGRFTEDQGTRAADLTQYFQEPVAGDANAESGMIAPEGTSSITVREMAKQSGKATDNANRNAANLATLRSFGDLMGDRRAGMRRAGSEIDQLSGFRRGSTDALASELDAASQAGAGRRLLGDLLSGAGSIATGYGGFTNAANPAVTNALGRFGIGAGAAAPASLRPMARPTNLLG